MYRVASIKDLANVIIPHFEKYMLNTQKRADFELFKQAIALMNRKEHLTMDGLRRIVAIKAAMNKGLSGVLKLAFPGVIPVKRPKVQLPKSLDPNWLAGFASGESSFSLNIKKSTNHRLGKAVDLRFKITQHQRDRDLLSFIIRGLKCGTLQVNGNCVEFIVTRYQDIKSIIIPFFHKYPIQGSKKRDYLDFCKAAELKEKKSSFNSRRFR